MVGDAFYCDDLVMVRPSKGTGDTSLSAQSMAEQAIRLALIISPDKSHYVVASEARFLGQSLQPPSSRAETPQEITGRKPPHHI